jgi:hypothetical protein
MPSVTFWHFEKHIKHKVVCAQHSPSCQLASLPPTHANNKQVTYTLLYIHLSNLLKNTYWSNVKFWQFYLQSFLTQFRSLKDLQTPRLTLKKKYMALGGGWKHKLTSKFQTQIFFVQ